MANNTHKINEAPITPGDFPTGHYLGRKVNRVAANSDTNTDMTVAKEIKKLFKDIKWQDIKLKPGLGTKKVEFVDRFNAKLNAIMAPVEFEISTEGLINKFSQGNYMFKVLIDLFDAARIPIVMKIDSASRTHFPNSGIPEYLRGIGLGKKLYRALIESIPYAKSQGNASEEAQYVWASLLFKQTDPTMNVFVFTKDTSYIYAVSTTREDNIETYYKLVETKYKLSNTAAVHALGLHLKNRRKEVGLTIDDTLLDLCENSESLHAKQLLQAFRPAENEILGNYDPNADPRDLKYGEKMKLFCGVTRVADLVSDFEVGDYIVAKDYLLQEYDPLPVRICIRRTERKAVGALPTDQTQERQYSTNKWVKALPPAQGHDYPPGYNGVPDTTPRVGETTGLTVKPLPPAQGHDLSDTTPRVGETTDLKITDMNITPSTLGLLKYSTVLTYPLNVRKKILRKITGSPIYIEKNPTTDYSYRGIPINGWAFSNGMFVPTKLNILDNNIQIYENGQEIYLRNFNENYSNSFVKYERESIESKQELSPGDLVFIKRHTKYFGWVARVKRVNLTSRGDNYIYLEVPGAGRANQLILTPPAVDKLIKLED
jgi:hypothetical protein